MAEFKMLLGGILVCILKYGFCGEPEPALVCGYEIRGLDSNITVGSSLGIGDNIFTLLVDDTAPAGDRKKRGVDPALAVSDHDVILLTETSYFHLTYSAAVNFHTLTVSSCLVAGLSETLEFMFNETLDEELACGIARLTVDIEATTPEFDIDSTENVIVNVDSCTLEERLKVSSVTFANDKACLVWSCGVKCLNDAKIFWIDSSTPEKAMYTSSEDVDFNKTYDLLLTCFERPVPLLSTNQMLLHALFNQSVTCASPGTTRVAANQLQETTPDGYFDEPANVALVASVSALTAGSALGVGLHILASKVFKRSRRRRRKYNIDTTL